MRNDILLYSQAIQKLKPGIGFTIDGTDYSTLKMADNSKKPSKADVQKEFDILVAEYDSQDYQRQRANEYPSMADQLDTIYHEGIEVWKEQIQAIKDKYPKPE
jgi:hypothetical protein